MGHDVDPESRSSLDGYNAPNELDEGSLLVEGEGLTWLDLEVLSSAQCKIAKGEPLGEIERDFVVAALGWAQWVDARYKNAVSQANKKQRAEGAYNAFARDLGYRRVKKALIDTQTAMEDAELCSYYQCLIETGPLQFHLPTDPGDLEIKVMGSPLTLTQAIQTIAQQSKIKYQAAWKRVKRAMDRERNRKPGATFPRLPSMEPVGQASVTPIMD